MKTRKSGKSTVVVLLFTSILTFIFLLMYKESILQFSGVKKPKDVFLGLRYDIHGIDISKYQGKINWPELATTTVNGKTLQFVFIKATEGETLTDVKFKKNWREAKKSGFKRGAYHYYKPNINASNQALFFVKNVTLSSGDLPPVLDIEETGYKTKKQLQADIRKWLKIVELKSGIQPIIYVNLHFYNLYIKDEFDDYLVWIAHYNTPQPRMSDRNWHFWQHTDKGKVGGIKHYVDLNVFNGSLEELNAICKR